MKSKRNLHKKKRSHSRRYKKGGFFFNKPNVLPSDCDPNQLSMIKDSNEMHAQYQKCCPKTFFGSKNSSPYCKQLELNFNAEEGLRRDVEGYYGEETDVGKIKETMASPMPAPNVNFPVSKPWWKFWGGKKTRHYKSRTKKNKTKKH